MSFFRMYKFSEYLLLWILIFFFVGSALSFGVNQYMGLDAFQSMYFYGEDGWCVPGKTGLGLHCFGDYSEISLIVNNGNPWAYGLNYSAAGISFQRVLELLSDATGIIWLGKFVYLVTLAICLVAPALWAMANKNAIHKVLIFSLLGGLAFPAVMAFDRGNTVGFLAAVELMLFIGVARNKNKLIILSIVIASVIKPHFALIAVFYLIIRKWKYFFITFGLVVGLNLSAYLLWPSSIPAGFISSLTSVLSFGGKRTLAMPFPTNVSFNQGYFYLELIYKRLTGQVELESPFVHPNSTILSLVTLGFILIVLFINSKKIDPIIIILILVASISLFPSITFAYYLVFTLPLAAISIRNPLVTGEDLQTSGGYFDTFAGGSGVQVFKYMLIFSLVLSITKIPLPLQIGDSTWAVWTSQLVLPTLWLVTIVWGLFIRTNRISSNSS